MEAKEYFLYVRNAFNEIRIVHLITDSIFASMGLLIYKSFIRIDRMGFDEVENDVKRQAILKYNEENKIRIDDSCEIFSLEKERVVLVVKDNRCGNLLGVFKQNTAIEEHGEFITFDHKKTFIKSAINTVYVKNSAFNALK